MGFFAEPLLLSLGFSIFVKPVYFFSNKLACSSGSNLFTKDKSILSIFLFSFINDINSLPFNESIFIEFS